MNPEPADGVLKPIRKPVLEVAELSFSYGARPVLTHWSAQVHAGVTWLRGSNGSGKSTLLRLLGGALQPLTGRLMAAGVDAAADPIGYRRQVFWCGPGAPAFDHLTASEFWAFMRGLYPLWDTLAQDAAVEGLSLQPHALRRLRELSTGTQRKVWLAAACAVGSPVVMLDEPLNALDAASLAWLVHRVTQAAQGTQAWLVASHQRPVAADAVCPTLDLSSG